jgi:Tfp pilus assembly protein PilE
MKVSSTARPFRRVNRQRGVGMVSMLLALVITAIVVGAVYSQYTDATRKARIEKAQAEVVTMIAESQKLYGNTNQYGAVTTAIAVRSGVVPPRLRVGTTTTAQNSYDGAITFTPATLTTTNDALVLGYGAVRREDCQDLVLGTDRLTRRIAVGATIVKPTDGTVNIATLATACDAAATVAINFTMGRGQ